MATTAPTTLRPPRGITPLLDATGKPLGSLHEHWPEEPTALLVIHGIGDQQPFSTLDGFALGIIGDSWPFIRIEHRLVRDPKSSPDMPWFDNAVRLHLKDSDAPPIDIHEYYWANLCVSEVSSDEILDFVRNTAVSGQTYYKELAAQGAGKDQAFSPRTYYWLLRLVFGICTVAGSAAGWADKLLSRIPIFGELLSGVLNAKNLAGATMVIRDAMGDVVAYTASDPRSPHHGIREKVLGGAVEHILRLIPDFAQHGHIGIFGHSLGTQIAVDAINRINILVSEGCVPGFNPDGSAIDRPQRRIADVVPLLVTFGSPVDKIAFFFRDVAKDDHPLRARIIENFHGFRQVAWPKGNLEAELEAPWQHRVFDSIRWVNYYCRKDLVSGALDYFKGVENVRFVDLPGSFPHGAYWSDQRLYAELRRMIANPGVPLDQPPPRKPRFELWFAVTVVTVIVLVSLAFAAAVLWFGGQWVLKQLGSL